MKKLLVLLGAVVLLVAMPQAGLAMPTPADAEFRLNRGDIVGPGSLLGYQVISNKVQLLKCRWSAAVHSSTTGVLKNVDGANCFLPANAIVIGGLIDVVTAPISTGLAVLSVGTGNSTTDLKAATAKASFTGRMDVIPTRVAATTIKVTAVKNPIITITGGAVTTGVFNVFIEYLLSN